ncbi:TolC family protein [Parendozoicomonas haliclonae]|uniref:Outer membrane efflux protein n=2 Tax=Parendozoicomonas haliclonae TaxID=1960125 RepID=A0A1X7AEW0_9GAMM|nr:Outer membrane efflux protein [Parendozoicomonas haliclonae]
MRAVAYLLSFILLCGCTALTEHPLSQSVIEARQERVARLLAMPAPEQLTPELALERLLFLNLDVEIGRYQAMFAQTRLEESYWQLLPDLALDGRYTHRSSPPDSTTSLNLEGLNRTTGSLSLTWTLLDFAEGYLRARQSLNNLYTEQQALRMTVNNMVHQLRLVYLRAEALSDYRDDIARNQHQLEKMLARLNEAGEDSHNDPLEIARYQRDLVRAQQTLLEMTRMIDEARVELAALLMMDESSLQLTQRERLEFSLSSVASSKLQQQALDARPELYQADYQWRNYALDEQRARWQWLPDPGFFAGYRYDDSPNLRHNEWGERGVVATFDLLNAIQAPVLIESARQERERFERQREALALTVIKQVQLADIRWRSAQQRHDHVQLVAEAEQKVDVLWQQRMVLALADDVARTLAGVNALQAGFDERNSYLKLLASYQELQVAVGQDQINLPWELLGQVESEQFQQLISESLASDWLVPPAL